MPWLIWVSSYVYTELQREARRKEYAEKQKSKLAAYQDRVKSETDKIQVIRWCLMIMQPP